MASIKGNARNNYLYGTRLGDYINGGLGNDYLRGAGGSDELWGGAGSDRFVFERNQADNGVDFIKDYVYSPAAGGGELDVLDLTLVGFARNALSRNSGIDNVVRIVEDQGVALVQVSPSGDGQSFQNWAVLEGLYAGNLVHFRIGAYTFTQPVQGEGGNVLRYDIGNGDRNGDGSVDGFDSADDDALFDDRLIVPIRDFGNGTGAEVLIGDRVRGFGGTTAFTPGVTAIDVPQWLADIGVSGEWWFDAVHDDLFQVYYGTYDVATDIFTVTSTPGTTAGPTSATHTMVLYDNDPADGAVGALGGMVFQGVYAESQWYIDQDSSTLQYDTDGIFASQEYDVLDFENVLYGTAGTDAFNGGFGIDIIYAGAGNDLLFGGSDGLRREKNLEVGPLTAKGNDWLYGGKGADIFFATNVFEGGIDTIKGFNGTDGDVMALALEASQIQGALNGKSSIPQPEGNGPQWWTWSQLAKLPDLQDRIGFYDIGPLMGSALEDALQAASAPGGVLTSQETDVNLFLLQHGGKDYLYLDVLGNGYGIPYQPQEGMPPIDFFDVIVEITGAVGLSASNIYVYAEVTT